MLAIIGAFMLSFVPVLNGQGGSLNKFPDDWLGVWQGELEIYSGQNLLQKVPMKMEHLATDSNDVYVWALIYGQNEAMGRRDYRLLPVDKSRGHWMIDEQNSIILDAYVYENQLISNFSIIDKDPQKNTNLISSYRLEGDHMVFEIMVFGGTPARKSGETEANHEKIPQVYAHPVRGYQRAVLKKM